MKCEASGKIIYRTYEQAQYQAKWRRKHLNQRTGMLYKCKYCGGWHSSHCREVGQKCKRRKPYDRAKIRRHYEEDR